MKYKTFLEQAIDLHVHVGPEIIPRKFNLSELINYESGKIKGMAIKNHFFPTVSLDRPVPKIGDPLIIDSVVLNNYVGGFNSDIILASAELSKNPIIVWFPTLHAKNSLKSQKFEIPKEWIGFQNRNKLKSRYTKDIGELSVINRCNKISKKVDKILSTIKDSNAILATGHISWLEALVLIKRASTKFGIEKIIVTHPIYQKINMPISVQKELGRMGVFLEHSYSMYSIDKISISKIAKQIKEVGPKYCILSSDVGQIFSKSPSESLADFICLLEGEGIKSGEIKTMLVDNPKRLLNLK
jgi:hypothetical protein